MIDPGLALHPSFIKMPTLTLPGGAVGLVYVYTVYRDPVHKLFFFFFCFLFLFFFVVVVFVLFFLGGGGCQIKFVCMSVVLCTVHVTYE